jgi:hypothetical protein
MWKWEILAELRFRHEEHHGEPEHGEEDDAHAVLRGEESLGAVLNVAVDLPQLLVRIRLAPLLGKKKCQSRVRNQQSGRRNVVKRESSSPDSSARSMRRSSASSSSRDWRNREILATWFGVGWELGGGGVGGGVFRGLRCQRDETSTRWPSVFGCRRFNFRAFTRSRKGKGPAHLLEQPVRENHAEHRRRDDQYAAHQIRENVLGHKSA